MKKMLPCIIAWLTLFCGVAAAQTKISGKVFGTNKDPLAGATVSVKNTRVKAVTNETGSFFITVPGGVQPVLVLSYTGYETREIPVSGSTVEVDLKESNAALGEVVVVGYGTQKKKDLTGAISQVKATQLENENPKTVQDMLRGNAPGLDVGFDASTKGGGSSLQIRGKGTLTASSTPLIVLDGVIYTSDLNDINPNDIATMDVLKDASSAAVFGARSANGVILITTKRGRSGKPRITFNDNIGLNKVENKPHFLDPYEFLDWRQDVRWAMVGFDSTSKPGVQYKFLNPAKLPAGFTVAQWQALDNSTGDPVVTW